MFRRLACLACLLLMAFTQPVVASPRDDADYVASHFVKSDGYRMKLHEMITTARVNGVRRTLSQHSVKVRDDQRLAELLSDFGIPEIVFDRLQRILADQLVERMTAEELASLVDHVRHLSRDPAARRPNAVPDEMKRVMTLDEFEQLPDEIAGLAESQTFKSEMKLLSVGITAISLAVQATNVIDSDLKPSEIADLMEVDGVFVFPNRIAQKELIRELRATDP